MKLPLRASLAVALSLLIALVLSAFVPPLVLGKEGYARGHGRGDALGAMREFAAEAADEGRAAGLVPLYAARYPDMDFELLSSDLRVIASSRQGKERYTVGELARLFGAADPAAVDEEDADAFLKELDGVRDGAYLLARLGAPFRISLTRQAIDFLGKGLVVAMALALLVFALALAAFSLPFARRVSRLARAISAWEPGSPPLAVGGRDESAEIAGAFNQMAAGLAAAEAGRLREEEARRREEESWRASVASLSHDLRTPLASVVGYSESLISFAFSDEEERLRYESIIHAKALYMARLLDSLLAYARLAPPPAEADAEELELCELLRSVVIEYLDEAERRGLEVVADIPDEGLLLRAEAGGVSRILRNLLDNALNYASSGQALEISLRAAPGPGFGLARLELRDFGPGIPEAAREKVFERYYRGDPADGDRPVGLGLGLPIARAIARREGGELSLESPEGGGCRFILILPLAAAT